MDAMKNEKDRPLKERKEKRDTRCKRKEKGRKKEREKRRGRGTKLQGRPRLVPTCNSAMSYTFSDFPSHSKTTIYYKYQLKT